MKDKFHLSWIKRMAIKVYLKSPRRVQIGLAKFGIKRVIHKKAEDLKKTFKAHA